VEMEPLIEFRDVTISYDNNADPVVEKATFSIYEKEIVAILGLSGCGKTTLLKTMRGFLTPRGVYIKGEDAQYISPKHRNIRMVPQRDHLFPFFDIRRNIEIDLRVKKLDKKTIDERVEIVAKLLHIEDLIFAPNPKFPGELSGGQQRRIMIAVKLAVDPEIILLDEPLSNLDKPLQHTLRDELGELFKKLGKTVVWVTHDQEEAIRVSDKMIVMSKGKIEQIGTPYVIYNKPENCFVAKFIGHPTINIVSPEIVGMDSCNDIICGIRPQDIKLSNSNGTPAIIKNISFLGTSIEIVIETQEQHITVLTTPSDSEYLKKGARTFFHLVSGANIHRFRKSSGARVN